MAALQTQTGGNHIGWSGLNTAPPKLSRGGSHVLGPSSSLTKVGLCLSVVFFCIYNNIIDNMPLGYQSHFLPLPPSTQNQRGNHRPLVVVPR